MNRALTAFENILLALVTTVLPSLNPLLVHTAKGSILLNAGEGLAAAIVTEMQQQQAIPAPAAGGVTTPTT